MISRLSDIINRVWLYSYSQDKLEEAEESECDLSAGDRGLRYESKLSFSTSFEPRFVRG